MPGLRRPWLLAVSGVCAAAARLAAAAGAEDSLPFLLLAPVLPLLWVAASYGGRADPFAPVIRSTPAGGLRLLMLRTGVVLAVCLPLLLAAAVAGVGVSAWAAAWLVPSLTLTLVTLVLGSCIGCLPQTFGMFRGFTVRECVSYTAWLKDMPGRSALDAVERAVDQVGLTARMDAKYRTLSGGTQRRVGIATALVNNPRLLLLDEPATGLDPAEKDRFHALLRSLGATTTVVLATHLMEDVHVRCDTAIVLRASRKVFAGPPRELELAGGYAAVVASAVP